MPFIGTTPTQGFVSSVNKQSFTANGSTTSFTLTHPVTNANDLEVFVGNVRQEPTAAYSASGTTLDFGSGNAPPNGVNLYVIYKNLAQVTTTPPDGSVGNAKITAMAASKLTGAIPVSTLTTSNVGMIKLLDATISSAVSEYVIDSTYFNSTYDTYFLTFHMLPSSDGVYLYSRGYVGGAQQGGSGNYYANEKSALSSSTYGNANSSIIWMEHNISSVGNAAGEGNTFQGIIQNVNDTTKPCQISGISHSASTGALHGAQNCSGSFLVANRASVMNGMNFYYNSGNIASGRVRLYGVPS